MSDYRETLNWGSAVTLAVTSSRGLSACRNRLAGMRGTVPGLALAKCSVTESGVGAGAAVVVRMI